MNTSNTPNSTEGPPTTTSNARWQTTADTAAPSPSTVHAPSSTSTNTNYHNPPAANGANQDVKAKPTAVEYPPANECEGEAADVSKAFASLPQPILPKPPRPFNIADYDEGEDAKLKNEAKQAMADASGNLSEVVASLPQPQPYRLEPPRPFNVAQFDEGEDEELKNKAKQVGASKHEDSIIVPTEEDMADGAALDPVISRERRTRKQLIRNSPVDLDELGGNVEREAVDLELGGEVELSQLEDDESEEVLQGDVAPFNSELPVLEAYIVEEESRRDVVTATHVEPILPWWKQRRTKLLLSAMFVVFAVMAIALGVSMSSSSSTDGEPLGVERTNAPTISQAPTFSFQPSASLVPTSIPSVSLRPSVHPSLPPTTTQSPSFTRLESSKLVADDWFGGNVAVFGDTLVAGAFGDDDKGDYSGSAYIYNRDPETKDWIMHQKLVADDGSKCDYFGSKCDYFGVSVAINGDTIVVGAYRDDDKGWNSGSAYIYHKDPESKEWILQQKLVADDGAEAVQFGSSVDIYSSTVVVGAPFDDDRGYYEGSAYVYNMDPATKEWNLQQKLVAADGAPRDYFGGSVAIYGDTIVVGELFDTCKRDDSGSAYIYHQDSETKEWILLQKLVADDGAAHDRFGSSVAIYGSTVVVGAPFDDDKAYNSGSAYIYQQDSETKEWIMHQNIVAEDGTSNDYFGSSVAVFGDTVVLGAYSDNTDKAYNSGSAYIYHQHSETKTWILQQKLVADDSAWDDVFGRSRGRSVAIYNGTVVVGASGDDDKGNDSGSVYVYS